MISFSFIARSYALCSSVRFGARIPSAPAIRRFATAVCFSGREEGDVGVAEGGEGREGREIGVGGGGEGGEVLVDCCSLGIGSFVVVVVGGVSLSSSLSSSSEASSSQESATGRLGFDGVGLLFFEDEDWGLGLDSSRERFWREGWRVSSR